MKSRAPRSSPNAIDRSPRSEPRKRAAPHQGFVLVSTIVCLMIASAITANVMRRVLKQRQLSQQRHWQDQADWLAVAAVHRAHEKLASDESYVGETWQPALSRGAKVSIQCDDDRIRIVADYPFDPLTPNQRARASRTVSRAED